MNSGSDFARPKPAARVKSSSARREIEIGSQEIEPLTRRDDRDTLCSLLMSDALRTVLYVEDEATDVFLMRRAFIKANIERALQTVPDGQSALDYLSGNEAFPRDRCPLPSVVLLDLNLPELHGFEVLKWIRSHREHRELPVVVFSSSARDEDRATARMLGANDYWQKPNSPLLFASIVEQLRTRWLSPAA